jgi:beta-lactamase class A
MFALPVIARELMLEASERIAALDAEKGGRLGVASLDSSSGRRITHRSEERFAMCSTFKFLAVALVLSRVDRKEERLDRPINFTAQDLVEYSPATAGRAGGAGMTILELCEAAMTLSDNTAGNLLLSSFGGPGALTAYARSLGDRITRLDRTETALNEAIPGDPRDTTTPAAMLENMRRIFSGDALTAASRERLIGWMAANRTGGARLRAGFPVAWRVGDKTGSGGHGATNDIAVAWPPGRAAILVAAYFAESQATAGERNRVLAEVGKILSESL